MRADLTPEISNPHVHEKSSCRSGRARISPVFALVPPLVLLPLALSTLASPAKRSLLVIPSGTSIVADGQVSAGEWSDAGRMSIEVEPGWKVTILFQHDGANLYFAFQNLKRGKEMRFPELLFDPHLTRSVTWKRGEWWLHSSFNLCEGNGEYNVYERNGVFQCSKEKSGWSANHFPLRGKGNMEVQVSFSKLGINPQKGTRFGFAMDLTDTQKNWKFWPRTAQLARPGTWATALLN